MSFNPDAIWCSQSPLPLDVRRCKRSHAAYPRLSNFSMAAKSCKRIFVRSDAAMTMSPPAKKPMEIRRHPAGNSGIRIKKPAVTAMRKTFITGNQILAKSLAPRTPYLRTQRCFGDVWSFHAQAMERVLLMSARPRQRICPIRNRVPSGSTIANSRSPHGLSPIASMRGMPL